MGCLNIDERHGLQTVLSDDPDSPAAPYVREYQPRSLQDLQQIGIIPKSADLEHLKQARDDALGARADVHVHLVPQILAQEANRYPDVQHYARAYNAGHARQSVAEAMSAILSTRYRYHPREADLLARKALSLETTLQGKGFEAVWRQIELAEDLFIRSPVVVARTIDSILARDVVIFRNGTLIADGSYLLISCRTLAGESLYWQLLSQTFNPNKQIISRKG
jgi:hypothetical protein